MTTLEQVDSERKPRFLSVASIEDHEPIIRSEAVERISRKAAALRDLHVINVKSTWVNGFLVSSAHEAADRIVQVLTDHTLHQKVGHKAQGTARQHILLSLSVEHYFNLFSSFETTYRLNHREHE